MAAIKKSWLEKLAIRKLIQPFNTGIDIFYRLSGSIQVVIPGEKSRELTRAYDPMFEKGGLLLASIHKKGDLVILLLEDIVFIPNISKNPHNSYMTDMGQFMKAIDAAFAQRRLPIIFHTHPTKSTNIIEEVRKYHLQMETSIMDRCASLISHPFPGGRLRLPEALVICNSSLSKGLFIGFYGGLVAPLQFKNRKNRIIFEFCIKKVVDFISTIETVEDALIKFGLSWLTFALARDNPRQTRQLIKEAVDLLPPLAYATADEHCFFGITYASNLKINIPKLDDASLLEDERMTQFYSNSRLSKTG